MINNGYASNKKLIYLLLLISLAFALNISFAPNSNNMLARAEKKTDILFLKGKFIMKDKKGAIVISDEKKHCHCPHYFR